jgi:hypothetical protein
VQHLRQTLLLGVALDPVQQKFWACCPIGPPPFHLVGFSYPLIVVVFLVLMVLMVLMMLMMLMMLMLLLVLMVVLIGVLHYHRLV